jgi:hypothetical protein
MAASGALQRVGSTRLRRVDLPARVRAAAEAALGAAVASEVVPAGGFSPGLASRLILTDGRRVLAKAINAERDPQAPELYRCEIEVMTALSTLSGTPARVPVPRLRWSFDDGPGHRWLLIRSTTTGRVDPADLQRDRPAAQPTDHQPDTVTASVLRWSHWRRRHRHRARTSHYRQRPAT